jgi:hypothetical protein
MIKPLSIILATLSLLSPFANANEVRLIELQKSEATCYRGKTAATAVLVTELLNQAKQNCKLMGTTTVLQDVSDQLEINLNDKIPTFCGGVTAHLKMRCLVIN